MKIVVCVKHVPDAQSDRGFAADTTTDRDAVDGLLSELDEYAVEEAVRLKEAGEDVEAELLVVLDLLLGRSNDGDEHCGHGC